MPDENITSINIREMTTSITFLRKRLVQNMESRSKDQMTLNHHQEKRCADRFITKNKRQLQSLYRVGANLHERLYRFEQQLDTATLSQSIEASYYELMQELSLFNEMRFQINKTVFPLFVVALVQTPIRRLSVA